MDFICIDVLNICSDSRKSKDNHIFLVILIHLFLCLAVACFIVGVLHCENTVYCLGRNPAIAGIS